MAGVVDLANGISVTEIKTKLASCFPSTSDPNTIGDYRGLRYFDVDANDDVKLPVAPDKIAFSDFADNKCLPDCVFNSPSVVFLQQPRETVSGYQNTTQNLTAQARVDFPSQPTSCPHTINQDPGFFWQVKAPGGRFETIEPSVSPEYAIDYSQSSQGLVTLQILSNQQNLHNHEYRMGVVGGIRGTYDFELEGVYDRYVTVATVTEYSDVCKFSFITTSPPPNAVITGAYSLPLRQMNITYCQLEDEYRGGGTFQAKLQNLFIGMGSSANWSGSWLAQPTIECQYLDSGTGNNWREFAQREASVTKQSPSSGRADGYVEITSRISGTSNEPWTGGGIYFSSLRDWHTWASTYTANNLGPVRIKVTAYYRWTHKITGEVRDISTTKTFGGSSGLLLTTDVRANCISQGPTIDYIRVLNAGGTEIDHFTEGDTIIIECKLSNYMVNGEFTARALFDDPNDIYDFGNSYSVVFNCTNSPSSLDQLFSKSNNGAAAVNSAGIATYMIRTEVNNEFTGNQYGEFDTLGFSPGASFPQVYQTDSIKAVVYAGYKIGALPHPPVAVPFAQSPVATVAETNVGQRITYTSNKLFTGPFFGPQNPNEQDNVDEGDEVQYIVTATNLKGWNGSQDSTVQPVLSFSLDTLNDTDDVAAGNLSGTIPMTYVPAGNGGKAGEYRGTFSIVTRDDPDHFTTKHGKLRFTAANGTTPIGVREFAILNTTQEYTTPTFSDIGLHGYVCTDGGYSFPVEEMSMLASFQGSGSFSTRTLPVGTGGSGSWHTGVDDVFSERLAFFMTPQEVVNINSQLRTLTYVNDEFQAGDTNNIGGVINGRVSVINNQLALGLSTNPGLELTPQIGFYMTAIGTYSVVDKETGENFNSVGSLRIDFGADHFRDRICNNTTPPEGQFLRYECRDASGAAGTAGFKLYEIQADGSGGELPAIFIRDNDVDTCQYDEDAGGGTETNYPECEQYWNALTDWWNNNGGVFNAGIPPFTNEDYGCSDEELTLYLTQLYGGGGDPAPPAYGTFHSAACGTAGTPDEFTRTVTYHNGVGGYYTEISYNSTLCGYQQYLPEGTFIRFECGTTETTKYTRFRIVANGYGGEKRDLTQTQFESAECGYIPVDHPDAGTVLYSYCGQSQGPFGTSMPGTLYTLYEVLADGSGGTTVRETANSAECGYVDPPIPPDHPPAGTLINEFCGQRRDQFNLYGKYHDGNGGFYNEIIEINSTECGYEPPEEPTDPDPVPGQPIPGAIPFCASVLGAYNTHGAFAQLITVYGPAPNFLPTISVIDYNSVECGYVDVETPDHPVRGTVSGNPYCGTGANRYTRYQKYHDGAGGTYADVIETNSADCGYEEPPTHPVRGTTSGGAYCGSGADRYTRYQDYHDGLGGTYTEVVERNSADCGYEEPPPPVTHPPYGPTPSEPFCANVLPFNTYGAFAKLQTYYNGQGGYEIVTVEENSVDCGYSAPPDHPVRGTASGGAYCGTGANQYTRYQKYHDGSGGTYTEVIERNSADCGYTAPPNHPVAGTPAGEAYCGTGSDEFTRYQDYHDGSGGTYTFLVERRSVDCGWEDETEEPTFPSPGGPSFGGETIGRRRDG